MAKRRKSESLNVKLVKASDGEFSHVLDSLADLLIDNAERRERTVAQGGARTRTGTTKRK